MRKDTNWTFLLFVILLAVISASTIFIFQHRTITEFDNWGVKNYQTR